MLQLYLDKSAKHIHLGYINSNKNSTCLFISVYLPWLLSSISSTILSLASAHASAPVVLRLHPIIILDPLANTPKEWMCFAHTALEKMIKWKMQFCSFKNIWLKNQEIDLWSSLNIISILSISLPAPDLNLGKIYIINSTFFSSYLLLPPYLVLLFNLFCFIFFDC